MPTNPVDWAALATQTGQQALGGIMGLMMGNYERKKQLEQQQKLQQLQITGQKEMTDYQRQSQLQMWKDTNYPAQVQMLKEAGLNPGLLYGMSGGGGTTAASTPGNVTGGQASGVMTNPAQIAATTAQLGLMRAQKENIEADTANKQAQTTKTTGIDTQEAQTRIQSLIQGISNQKAQERLTQIEGNIRQIDELIKSTTKDDQIDQIQWLTLKSIEELTQAQQDTFIKRATANDIVDEIKARAIGAVWQNALMQSNIAANYAEIQKWATELIQGWEKLDQGQQQIKINDYEAKLKEKYPNLWTVGGKMLNGAIEAMTTIIKKAQGKEHKGPYTQ